MLKAIHMLKCFTGPAIKGSGIKLNLLATPSLSDLIGNGEHSDPCQRKPEKLMGKSDPLIKQNQLKKKKKRYILYQITCFFFPSKTTEHWFPNYCFLLSLFSCRVHLDRHACYRKPIPQPPLFPQSMSLVRLAFFLLSCLLCFQYPLLLCSCPSCVLHFPPFLTLIHISFLY